MKLELFPSPSPRGGMPSLPRKRMLDNISIIPFLLLALSSSRADYNVLARILGRGVKGDAFLYSFQVTLGYFMLRKTCFLSSGILPVCIAFGGEG